LARPAPLTNTRTHTHTHTQLPTAAAASTASAAKSGPQGNSAPHAPPTTPSKSSNNANVAASCSSAKPCPNPNWSCCAGKCLSPARGLACVADAPCPSAAVCGGPWLSGSPSCCTAAAGVCVAGGTRCCPRARVCGDACCADGESCGADSNGAARCRSALPRPLLDARAGGRPSTTVAGKRTAVASAREAGTAGPLLFDDAAQKSSASSDAERRWRSAGYQEDPCGSATAVLTATRLVGGADPGSGRDLAGAEGRATATVRACCELCATTGGCGHFSFDADGGKCWLKAASAGGNGKPAIAKRLSAAVVASSEDDSNDAPSLAFAADPANGGGGSVLQGLWAVPSRAFVSGTLARAPSPEMCPQARLCSGSGAASCCPGPVAKAGGNGGALIASWTCAASGACCAPNSGPPCGSGCGCTPGHQCSPQGRCVAAAQAPPTAAAAALAPASAAVPAGTSTAALLNQQAVLQRQPAGSVVNYAAALNDGGSLMLVQDPSDPQGCRARAEATAAAGGGAAGSAFAFRANTAVAPRSGGALNRDRPTLAATAAACCHQCAGVANCHHFSWDGQAMACSLWSDRAGADGAAKATRLEVPKSGSVVGDMIPKSLGFGFASADATAAAATAALADAAGAQCAAPCGSGGLCCDAGREACLAPTGLGANGDEHTCCPRDSVCGKRCGCDAGDACVAASCCPAARACGGGKLCCGPSERCSADGNACVRDASGGGLTVITGAGAGGGPYNGGFRSNNWGTTSGYGTQFAAAPLTTGGRR